MPQVGNFSLELIDATTKQKFKDHGAKNGYHSYFEVEPGVEYFLSVTSHHPRKVKVRLEVDGKDLGYRFNLRPNKTSLKGLGRFNSKTMEASDKALRFHKATVLQRNYLHGETTKNNIGVVSANFYEYIGMEGFKVVGKTDFNSDISSPNQVEVMSGDNKIVDTKKCLKSGAGSTIRNSEFSCIRRKSKMGKKLESIKVKYCSTVGLICDGILSKPPAWEWFKMTNRQTNQCTSCKTEIIEPTILMQAINLPHGNENEMKKYELFDLTTVVDDLENTSDADAKVEIPHESEVSMKRKIKSEDEECELSVLELQSRKRQK